MGLLDSLKLKPPKNWPPRPPAAPAAATAIGAAVVDATPEVFETQGRSAHSPRRVSSMPVEPVAAASAAPRKAGDGTPLSRTDEAGFGDFSLGIKESEDGSSLVVKYEKKQNIGRQNFKVWVIPCYVKADLKLAIEGEIDFADAGRRSLKVSAGGSIEVSAFGYTSEIVTFGPNGTGTLSASTSLPTRLSEARKLAIEPFVIDIHGNGTVGIKVEIEGGPTSGASVELANWHLFVIHVGTYVNGGFASVRVEPGKDMKRLIAAMEKAGPAIADTVEKYAPDGVKQIAEEAARWVAEDRKSKAIADATQKALDEIRKRTGVDLGGGIEKSIQFLVEPEGETANAATERVRQEMVAFNASYDDYKTVMGASGLDSEFASPLYRTAEEYNAIVDVWAKEAEAVAKGGSASGAWRPMVEALVAKCRAKRAELEAAEAARKRKAKSDAELEAAAALAARVTKSEQRMRDALELSKNFGNPLNNRTLATPQCRARTYWLDGMKYRDPGTLAMQQVSSLQGEARIRKADEAAALFLKAAAKFREGTHITD